MLKAIFENQILQQRNVRSAFAATIIQAGELYATSQEMGDARIQLLEHFGVINPKELDDEIQTQRFRSREFQEHARVLDDVELSGPIGAEAESLLNNPSIRSFYIVVSGRGGVAGVPTPDCIEAHLPLARRATVAEIEAAWEACSA